MPMKKGTSRENCISINYKELKSAGRTHKVAQAASLNHCNKIYGGIEKKEEIPIYKLLLKLELEDIESMDKTLQKKKKFIKKIISKVK